MLESHTILSQERYQQNLQRCGTYGNPAEVRDDIGFGKV